MKLITRILTFVVLLCCVGGVSAQVTWSDPVVEGVGGENYRVKLTATLDDGWRMYDMVVREGGPNATQFSFEESRGVTRVGEVTTTQEAKMKRDEMFMMEIGYYEHSVTFVQEVQLKGGGAKLDFSVEWMLCNDVSCVAPTDKSFSVVIGEATVDPQREVDPGFSVPTERSLWSVIIEAILWGLAALLTPCVFPMVPMTISYFMKGEGGEARGRFSALLYGGFIVGLYTLPIAAIILVTRVLGGDAVTADIFNWVATHWFPNLLFFVVFMVFAASFFGAFEITLPSSWVNKSDSRADRGTVGGIFFLALTLVLVSFSCTGPIVGSVLIKSTAGEIYEPIVTMFAFSLAFALPFVLVALFPRVMQRLPKSGGWLGSVKVVLGFLELALGLKFLSVADQTYGWGVLDREIYLAIWIVIFALLGLYLLGKLQFSHEKRVESIGVTRLGLSIVVFSFVVYMLPGMWGAPLKALSGYLPPLETQDFVMGERSEMQVQRGVKYGDIVTKPFPNGLSGFYDLAEAQEYANSVGKPLLIDFTGHGCVNCREMEQKVWSDRAVNEMLRERFVVVALYMDDKAELPESEWVTTSTGRLLKSLGRINSHLALERFRVNSQPTYIIVGRDGKPLLPPRGYNLSIEGYLGFLRLGLEKYHKGSSEI